MKKNTGKNLVKSINADLRKSDTFELIESKTKLPLSGFHSFADGRPCLGAFLIAGEGGEKLWVLVIDWKGNGDFYVVIYPESHSSSPIAELHNQIDGPDSVDLVWTYQPHKQDGHNAERKKAFLRAAESLEYIVSIPGEVVTLDEFMADLFQLAYLRLDADKLTTQNKIMERGNFPEGNRIEKLHKSRERNTAVVRLAKAQYSEKHRGKLPCEVCGFEFLQRYGEIGETYIEAHHIRPLSELESGETRNTKVEDLAMVCSNCHRMLHKRRPWSSIAELKSIIKK